MQKIKKYSFNDFYNLFPKQDLPFVIHTELHHELPTRNISIYPPMAKEYLIDGAGIKIDEFTEFIPVFRLHPTHDYVGLVVWKESLMTYEYFLITYDRKGQVIDKQIIAGQIYSNNGILTRIATLEADGNITMIEGETDSEMKILNEESTREFNFEITPNGFIVNL